MPAFSLACAPQLLTILLRRGMQRSSTDPDCSGSRCFGIQLIPDHLRRYSARPVSYYALFKWWLLLSQHPGCHSNVTSLVTKHQFGALAVDLGCFPLVPEAYPSGTDSRDSLTGIRSLVRLGSLD